MNKKLIMAMSLSMVLCSCGLDTKSSQSTIEPSSESSSSTSQQPIESSSRSSEPVSDQYYELNEDKKSYSLIMCPISAGGSYEVPSNYNGLPVTGIKKTAFANLISCKELTIPSSVTFIEKGALLPISSTLEKLVTPFIGEMATDQDSYLGIMFGFGNIIGKNQTSYYAPSFISLTITNQEVLPTALLAECNTLTSLVIQNCKEIGSAALMGMIELQSLSLPDGLKVIGASAFSGDTKLTSLDIPDSVESMGGQALYGLPYETFKLPASLESFTYYQDMPNLKQWQISSKNEHFLVDDGVLYSKDYATLINFPKMKDATSFVINPKTTKISTHAFEKTNIGEIDLANITSIGTYAFYQTKSLSSVTFGESISFIGSSAFYANVNLKKIEFASSLKEGASLEMENLIFAACTSLKEATLPEYIDSIPSSLFASCSSLSSINVLGSLKHIGVLAFSKTKIRKISLTFQNEASIDGVPFSGTNLSNLELHFDSDVTIYPTLASTGLGATPNIIVDSEEIAASLKTVWSNSPEVAGLINVTGAVTGEFIISDGVLLSYDDSKSSDPTRIIIPDGVTSIAKSVFTNLEGVQYIYIPSSVTSIALDAFKGCQTVMEIELGHEDPTILNTDNYFYRKFGVTDATKTVFAIQDPNKIEEFKAAFGMHSSKTIVKDANEVVLDKERNELYNLDKSTLLSHQEDSESTSYSFLDSVVEVGSKAFYGNTSIEEISWNNVTTIGKEAFAYCTSINELSFGEKVTMIDEGAFEYHGAITKLTFKGATNIAASAFYGNEEEDSFTITELDLGNKLVSIGDSAFAYSVGSAIVTIPSSCKDVNYCAFAYYSEQENNFIYFENNIETYISEDYEDYKEWAADFTSEARDLADVTVAFYAESSPEEDYSDYDFSFWHYNENGEKELYE